MLPPPLAASTARGRAGEAERTLAKQVVKMDHADQFAALAHNRQDSYNFV